MCLMCFWLVCLLAVTLKRTDEFVIFLEGKHHGARNNQLDSL